MKTKELEFEFDCIGEQNPLTIEEEKALSAYFKNKKASLKSSENRKPVRKSKSKTISL